MNKVNKIIVTGDVFRLNSSSEATQNINIRWLYELIQIPLAYISNMTINHLYYSNEPYNLVNKIFHQNHLSPMFESWLKLYNKKPSNRDLAVIFDTFDESLIISFELPEFLKIAFDTLQIPYIDFTIHPVRFLDDLLFAVRSNISNLHDALKNYLVTDTEILMGVGLAKATLSRIPRIDICERIENIGLFAGQTTDDKVLIKNSKILCADDFMDQFSEISINHELVLVKPHPYAKENNIILALTRLFPNIQLIDNNFYHLLSHDNISHVYSITSSTSIEAAYFNKKGIHLGKYPYIFSSDKLSNGAYLAIQPELYQINFWASIFNHLELETTISSMPDFDIPKMPNRLRYSLRNFWGADIFI